MATHALIKFPAGNVRIQLLKSPATELWLDQLYKWQEEGIPLSTQRGLMLHHGWEGLKRRDPRHERECVAGINQAIADVNALTTEDSTPFPYEAFVDMPWAQTNLIHRSFTLGLSTRHNFTEKAGYEGGIWEHDLTQDELTEYTEKHCYDNRHYVKWQSEGKQAFFYDETRHEEMNEALERINMWVHLYENRRYSERSGKFLDVEAPEYMKDNELPGPGPIELNFTWDNYNEHGGRDFLSACKGTSQEFTDSIPDHWMDYDVFLIKSITGKDYETSYQNYDDPTEYDTQNAQDITGGFRIFPNGGHRILYGDSGFGRWIRSYGINYKNYAPVPIGKIIEVDFDLTLIDSQPGEHNSDGSGAVQQEYRAPTVEIIEVPGPEDTTYPEEIIEDPNNFI